jgi:hypothetical protein
VVSLRLVTDVNGTELDEPKTVGFGDTIFDKLLVTERIRRAQCAILNPNTDPDFFLDAGPDDLKDSKNHLTFSSNSVCLEISGKDMDDLSFFDLPGGLYGHTN